jgi:hypothetical protein
LASFWLRSKGIMQYFRTLKLLGRHRFEASRRSQYMTSACSEGDSEKRLLSRSRKRAMCSAHSPALETASIPSI